MEAQKSWKQPFKIVGFLFMEILSNLSPPRRVYYLCNLILATLSLVGFSFLFLTREIELLVAFLGMVILDGRRFTTASSPNPELLAIACLEIPGDDSRT